MSVCVGASGPVVGLGSNSGMSLPHHHHQHHHHHHHMPGLMPPLGGGGVGIHNHQTATGGSQPPPLMSTAHLFHTALDHHHQHQLIPNTTNLGTLDSHGSAISSAAPASALDGAAPTSLPPSASKMENAASEERFPGQDVLLALISRNKALEGESRDLIVVRCLLELRTSRYSPRVPLINREEMRLANSMRQVE